MKKLLTVVVLTLALNFLAAAGGVGYLFKTGRLDQEKALAIKDLLFAPPASPAADAPATQPADEAIAATTRPIDSLEQLLARHAGRPAGEQVEIMQRSFDAQMALLDRRQRELLDLQRQVELSKQQMQRDRAAFDKARTELAGREKEASKLATDKGFQDSLALYNTMPGKQVKTIFMTLDDETIRQYLQALSPRSAARIVKEFKAPDEVARIQRVMESMRTAAAQQASASASESAAAPAKQ